MRVEDQFLYPLFFAFSPDTGWGGAYCVYPAVYIYPDGNGVDNSYGSPVTSIFGINNTWYVRSVGDLGASYVSDYSYGK